MISGLAHHQTMVNSSNEIPALLSQKSIVGYNKLVLFRVNFNSFLSKIYDSASHLTITDIFSINSALIKS
jgi:hypothetical protein